MGVALIIFLTAVFGIWAAAKFLLFVISYSERNSKPSKNPYIEYHELKNKNDDDYQDYLEWLKKEGRGVPVEKMKSPEDVRAENKIKKLF